MIKIILFLCLCNVAFSQSLNKEQIDLVESSIELIKSTMNSAEFVNINKRTYHIKNGLSGKEAKDYYDALAGKSTYVYIYANKQHKSMMVIISIPKI